MIRLNVARMISKSYRRLIRFYPDRLREEFSAEMADVFETRIGQVCRNSFWPGIKLLIQEFFDLSGIVIRAAILNKEGMMQQTNSDETIAPDPHGATEPETKRIRAWQVFLGVLPLLIAPGIGIAFLMSQPTQEGLTPAQMGELDGVFLGGILFLLIGQIYSWKHDFPVWTFPYWGIMIPGSFFLTVMSTPGLAIFGIPIFGSEKWGLRAWIPMLFVILASIAITRSFRPLAELIKNMSRDWTIVSFALYLPLQFLLWFTFDEMHGEGLFLAGMHLILAAGGLVYLLSSSIRIKIISLLAGLSLSWLASGVYIDQYWNGQNIPGTDLYHSGSSNLVGMAIAVGFLALCLCLPWLVVTFIRMIQKRQSGFPPTAPA